MEQKFNQWTQLFDCKELNAIQLRVLLLILNYHNIDNWDNTSLKKLKTDSGAAINTVAKSVNELEEKGLIKTVITSYKKSFKPTYDYLPQYEAIQKLINDNHISKIDKCDKKDISKIDKCYKKDISKIDKCYKKDISKIDKCYKKDISKIDNHISNNDTNIYQKMTEHISKIDNKYNTINKTKEIEKENRKEKPENPVNGNQESNFISDSDNKVKINPNNMNNPNKPVNNPRSANLDYIDRLERQFNGISNKPTETETQNPKATANPKTTATQNPKTGGKYLSANPNLTSDYIKSIPCMYINLSILNDLIEASKRPTLVIDAMEKSIELLHTYRGGKGTGLFYIAQVYDRASQTIKSKNGMSEKQLKLATDKLAALKKDIVDCGGAEELRLAQTVQ